MKKIYLLLSFMVISLGMVKSSPHTKVINNPYTQIQITKSIFADVEYKKNWFKLDSSKIILDFIDNNKIIIDNDNNKSVYDVKIKKIDKYNNCQKYIMKGVDSYNHKYDIDVIYYEDESALLVFKNDSTIIRYKIRNINKS